MDFLPFTFAEELKAPLEEYVHKRYPGLVKVVRNQKREGLIRARIEGWKVATGQVTGFFDAHVEFTAGWAEPVLSRIQENRKRVILPSIDNIKQDNFEVQRYENSAHGYSWELWCMYISPPKDWWDAGDPSLPIRKMLTSKGRKDWVDGGDLTEDDSGEGRRTVGHISGMLNGPSGWAVAGKELGRGSEEKTVNFGD
ncbi:Putative polypeptide N-acetylgalactosaminyltransferase-like protein 3 [Fukomys damarensis]|uniref:Putative polypeptide N-acetylgalactosaminyltransferase-like protein 3 n=1 Tax=Fukomys damarensis TaxID=885580 RepID=A0A091D3A6_FUKDA|nr:Putative polypeptide N-acetylgalactosaminyltransferase-like protein 3 [Fukomys damarensis]